ncbi:hypothetical protein TVAG_125060 [Trichomonas vaginalis G3]|uniref:Right handed beta helix domain-containing protein n=1 Tax=Trichomonas vaginalis (strain ATCC PRA-98 / G3) TaxID=412133 RepID=A2EIL2_TRIV3|nr:hypothetical protein TVAGG3_0199610 [Trichomonas vaginalis G3]EAY07533.1 hypothetical protein TVAG_125060 [Trichomonas vaginalis G3]KAI5550513.1 hypothetical protein TVAGG3_0199610 [Trichomonas vaginalis G3]|eukprot:XP_001319756.1 hypothetical protein [Trichomonas vaginalis G3]
MVYGFCIMNECNITQNRVKEDKGGYLVSKITSDSYITCVNVVENNQSSGTFNYHASHSSYSSSKFKVTSCNYIRNKSPNEGSLIYSASDVFMSYCCIRQNEIKYIFKAYSTITFECSTTDSNKSYEYGYSPTFKNTDISFENEHPLFNLEVVDSLKYKCRHPTPNNDENEDKVYVRNHIKFFYLFLSRKRFRSQT